MALIPPGGINGVIPERNFLFPHILSGYRFCRRHIGGTDALSYAGPAKSYEFGFFIPGNLTLNDHMAFTAFYNIIDTEVRKADAKTLMVELQERQHELLFGLSVNEYRVFIDVHGSPFAFLPLLVALAAAIIAVIKPMVIIGGLIWLTREVKDLIWGHRDEAQVPVPAELPVRLPDESDEDWRIRLEAWLTEKAKEIVPTPDWSKLALIAGALVVAAYVLGKVK